MSGLNERINAVLAESGLTTTEFAKRINLSQSTVSGLRNGKQNPSERTLIDIADKFNINEEWLRTGEGPMKVERTRPEEIATFAGELPILKRRLASALANLNEGQWDLLLTIVIKLAEEVKEKPGKGPGNGQDDQ